MLDFDDGIHLIGTDLWLDPRRVKPRAIVSHAHSDHVGRHRQWVTSPGTGLLALKRWNARAVEVREFGVPWEDDGARVTLLPAGHILGSAMVLLERAGTRILYTGDFRLEPSATAEPCTPVAADVLVMECTFGEPIYRFPRRTEVLDRLDEFIAATHRIGGTPVLLAYSLGKAQEVARLVSGRGHDVWLLDEAHALLEVYREAGVAFERCARFEGLIDGRGVLIVPPDRGAGVWRRVPRPRTAFLSGWAIGPPRWRPRCDVALPLSDHADFDELVRLVERVKPRQVYTLHGPDRFAAHLRERGWDATPARHARQLTLF
ncbi:MAG: MBL fold metallo-hydrolase RNA specificity domain-containing protein [Candidatus Eisenbacteria bacterium]